ncbi:hypothetical protein BDR05DRAFT_956802 [Suillus weaverae]|nr:hypothetical protein BDR05DRAFT_956802 [Suillus weaverae]
MLAYNERSILEADPDYPRDGTTDAQEEFILEAAWTQDPFEADRQKHRRRGSQ